MMNAKKKTDGFGLDVHLLIVEGESLTSWPHVWIEIWVAGYFFKMVLIICSTRLMCLNA